MVAGPAPVGQFSSGRTEEVIGRLWPATARQRVYERHCAGRHPGSRVPPVQLLYFPHQRKEILSRRSHHGCLS
jgi:hypothetical protein